MRVVVDADLFLPSAADPLVLCALLQLGFEGRHDIQTDPAESPSVQHWLSQRDDAMRDSCRLALDLGIEHDALSPSRRAIRVAPVDQPQWDRDEPALPLDVGLHLLRTPFSVLLEDSLGDKWFLLAVATAERKCRLQEFERKGWLEFSHGGGITGIERRLESLLADRGRILRTWALFDSDALRPGAPSDASQAAARACSARSVAYHRLRRRAIENYVPLPALERWNRTDEQKRRVRALGRLTPAQRHHYNMKHGFSGDANRLDRCRVGDLYDGLDEDTRSALDHGIDRDIAGLFRERLFRMETWWFEQDGQSDETDGMLDELLSLL